MGPPRPTYLANQENDRVMMIVMALAAEVSALRERLDTHEALGEKRRFATVRAVDAFKVPAPRREDREKARQDMLSRVLRILLEDLDAARNERQGPAAALLSEETSESP